MINFILDVMMVKHHDGASLHQGPRFDPVLLSVIFSLCSCGFPPGYLVFTHLEKMLVMYITVAL